MQDDKKCGKCGEVKALDEFYRRNKNPDGRQPWCKRCANKRRSSWASENRDKTRVYTLWDKYRLREADWNSLHEKQGGLCGACGTREATVVDHDHSCCSGVRCCGKCVRALLCSRCNTLVGFYEKEPESFRYILQYLEDQTPPPFGVMEA